MRISRIHCGHRPFALVLNMSLYQMGVPPVRVDILMGIPGIKFTEAWERRLEIDFGDLPVTFISRQDLITAKRASGRPQDLLDADLLSKPEDD